MSLTALTASSGVCACGRDATLGRLTCARCRCVALADRLCPGERFGHLEDDVAVIVERSLLEAEAALLRARAASAVAAGVRTENRPAPGEDNAVHRTFVGGPRHA